MERAAVAVLATFGRVPFFFYIVHVYVIHTATVAAGWLQGYPGAGDARLLSCSCRRSSASRFRWSTCCGWRSCSLMYPICRWFASVKANHRHPLLLVFIVMRPANPGLKPTIQRLPSWPRAKSTRTTA